MALEIELGPVENHEIELCDLASVEKLLDVHARPSRALRGENLSKRRAITAGSRHCKCGGCKFCLENDRWNRIFEAKFADPTYYSGPIIRHSSALNSF